MPSKLAEATSHNFDPMSAPGLSDEARKAVKVAFDAMSTWRTEIVNDNEKNLERVIDKIAAAARALGFPMAPTSMKRRALLSSFRQKTGESKQAKTRIWYCGISIAKPGS